MSRSILIPVITLAALCSLASAQVDEGRCRSAASIYTAPASGLGTVTGLPTDRIIIKRADGTVVSNQTVQYWINRPYALPIWDIQRTSSGMYSVRFYYPGFAGNLVNGTVEVTRNGAVIDRDRLIA